MTSMTKWLHKLPGFMAVILLLSLLQPWPLDRLDLDTPAYAASGDEARFVDSFISGTAEGWTLGSPNWKAVTVQDTVYGTAQVLSQTLNSNTPEYTFIGNNTWTDYTLDVTMKPKNTSANGGNAVLFRASDNKNGYWFRFYKNAEGTTYLQLFRSVNGTLTNLGQKTYAWQDGGWYQIKIALLGAKMTISVNGVNEFTYTDTGATDEVKAGGIGFRSYLSELDVDRVEARGTFKLPEVNLGGESVLLDQGVQLYWRAWPEPETAAYRVLKGVAIPDSQELVYVPLATVAADVYGQGYLDAEAVKGSPYSYVIEALDATSVPISSSKHITGEYTPGIERLYIDSFNDGTADGWRLGSGSWVTREAGGGTSPATFALAQSKNSNTTEYTFLGNATWTDYTAVFTMRALNTSPGGSASVLFRANGDKNFYMFRLVKTTSGAFLIQTFKVLNGKLTTLTQKPFDWVEGTWYEVKISAIGTKIQVQLNGTMVTNVDDTTDPLLTGGIGFRSYLTEMEADRVEVAGKISPPEQNYNIRAKAGTEGISMEWNASLEPEAASYQLYRGTLDAATGLFQYTALGGPLSETVYMDTDVTPGTTYSYYLEVSDVRQRVFSVSNPALVTPLQEEVVAELQNDKLKLEFVRTSAEGTETFIGKRIFLSDGAGGWLPTPVNPLDEKYAVVYAANVQLRKLQFQEDNQQTHPVWSTTTANQTPNVFSAGETTWVRPSEIEITEQGVVLQTSVAEQYDLQWTWTLAEDGWPQVKQTFTPRKTGHWSVVAESFFRKPLNEINNIQLGFLINNKRLPSQPYMVPEYQLPNPLAMAEVNVEGAGPVQFGLAPDASEIPARMAKLETSKFGMLINAPDGGVQPGLAAPLLGAEGSLMTIDKPYTFDYHYIVERGDWSSVYEKVARRLYGFKDYRTSWQTSLTDAVHNMIELMMDDEHSGWWERAKGFKDIEILNAVKHGNSLAAWEAYLLTGDENIYRKRVLPLTESLISRSDRVFSPTEEKKGPGAVSDLGGAAYGAAALMPMYEMGKRSSAVLYNKGLQELSSGNKASLLDVLAGYRSSKDPNLLNQAKLIGDQIVASETKPGQTYTLSGTAFVFSNWPDWEALMDLYELTLDERYLEGVVKAADQFLTSVWMQPVPGKEIITVPGASVHRSPYVHWTGDRLGWPYDIAAMQRQVEGWIPSQAGLTLEQGITYEDLGGNGNIMNPNWAGYLLRLSQLTGKELYKDAARSAVVGRFGNYPGYYYRQYSVQQMDPRYPYDGPDITELYYHHIPIQIGLTLDFMINDMMYRAGGKIRFEGETDPGLSVGNNSFLWFRNKYYAHKQGEMYGMQGMQLWLPKGLVTTGTPQVSWIAATNGSTVAVPLMNYDEKPTTLTVKMDSARMGAAATRSVKVFDADGGETLASMSNGQLTLTLPAKGMMTVVLDGLNVKLQSLEWKGNSLQPDQQKLSYSKDVQEAPELGTIEGALLLHNNQEYDAYVYSTVKDSVVSEAVLHYNDGQGWKRQLKREYPFEFSVGPIPQEQPFQYIVETRTLSGKVHSSAMKSLVVTDELSWQQERVKLRLARAETLAGSELGRPLSAAKRTALINSIKQLRSTGQQVMLNTANGTPETTKALLLYLREVQKVQEWLNTNLPVFSGAHANALALHECIKLTQRIVSLRLAVLMPVEPEITTNLSSGTGLFQGEVLQLKVNVKNTTGIPMAEGKVLLQLPEGWALESGTSSRSLPKLLQGQSAQQIFMVRPTAATPTGTYMLPVTLKFMSNTAHMERNNALKVNVISKLRLELSSYRSTLLAGEAKPLDVTLFNDGAVSMSGTLHVDVPSDWTVEGQLAFEALAPGTSVTRTVQVKPSAQLQASEESAFVYADGGGAVSPKVLWRINGTRNVALSALGSIATASTELTGNNAAMKAIDGGYSSPQVERWISLDTMTQHDLTVAFGKPRTINKVIVRHMGVAGDPSFNTADFQLQYANSESGPWTNLTAPIVGNTDSVTEHTVSPVTATHLRLHITKGSPKDAYARIYEIEAYLAGTTTP
ncbi:hypothetical protein SY83_03405 [Paenibacillus swuensis]|uniref:F5/8 type C domain-containing protein n=1 Tax=Paenibacillus swuensis TaxID=1178515 RepID=A0A172TF63_9BACL|nr:NEW3 domain-containing protein [Paenibacillus swuensis]ANE45517.1 hypothetical protein SY83_03405 [Paenibacillus swuensis]